MLSNVKKNEYIWNFAFSEKSLMMFPSPVITIENNWNHDPTKMRQEGLRPSGMCISSPC